MEIEQLQHFLKVSELGSFTQAAASAKLSQSAISRSIARLETEIGQPLFDRLSRKAVLNDAGKLLLDRARKILAMVEDAKAEITDDGRSGRVRVAAIPTIAPYLLPDCIQSFQTDFPKAQLIIDEDTTDNLIRKISAGEVDLAIVAMPIEAKYIDIESLFVEELLLVTSRNHPLARKKKILISDIESLPFVLLGEAHCLAGNITSFCRKTSFHPISIERTSQLAMVQELVALGHGISLIPAMARIRDNSPNRVYRSLASDKPTRSIVLISNPYRYHSQLVQAFRKHLKSKVNRIKD